MRAVASCELAGYMFRRKRRRGMVSSRIDQRPQLMSCLCLTFCREKELEHPQTPRAIRIFRSRRPKTTTQRSPNLSASTRRRRYEAILPSDVISIDLASFVPDFDKVLEADYEYATGAAAATRWGGRLSVWNGDVEGVQCSCLVCSGKTDESESRQESDTRPRSSLATDGRVEFRTMVRRRHGSDRGTRRVYCKI